MNDFFGIVMVDRSAETIGRMSHRLQDRNAIAVAVPLIDQKVLHATKIFDLT